MIFVCRCMLSLTECIENSVRLPVTFFILLLGPMSSHCSVTVSDVDPDFSFYRH